MFKIKEHIFFHICTYNFTIVFYLPLAFIFGFAFIFIAIISCPSIFSFTGIRDSKGTDEIVVGGNFKEIAGVGEASLYIIVERKAFKPVSVAVAFNPKAIEPSSVLYNLVGVDLKEVCTVLLVKIKW